MDKITYIQLDRMEEKIDSINEKIDLLFEEEDEDDSDDEDETEAENENRTTKVTKKVEERTTRVE